MVKIGRTKTRLHSDLAERDVDAKSHPAIYHTETPGIQNVALGWSTRNASGNQVISGLGFTPKIVFFLAYATGGTHQIMSIGVDDGTIAHCVLLSGHEVDAAHSGIDSILVWLDDSNNIAGSITSMDADGFTIGWVLAGAVTATFVYLAMK